MARYWIFLLAVAAWAQTYEIRGTASEIGGGGVPDVDVTALRIEDGAKKATKTDGQGVYSLTVDQPGAYAVGGSKTGYFGATANPVGGSFLMISAAQPQTTFNISLIREGEVTGRVLDETTREPVGGVSVWLYTTRWNFGRIVLTQVEREPAISEADGRFRFPGVRPGDYLASVRAMIRYSVLDQFSQTDIDAIDESFAATFWPGGESAESALPAHLISGGYADVGTLFLRKTAQYRVHLSIQGTCTDGELVKVSVVKSGAGPAVTLRSFPCGAEMVVRGFDPGSYAIHAASERRNGNLDTGVSGVARFEIVDKNAEVTLVLQRNIVLEGQLTIADGANAPRLLPRIVARPIDEFAGAQLPTDATILWAPDQRHFQLAVSPTAQSLVVSDSGPYVKEIRYNNTPLRGSTLPVNSGSAAHNLEIILDDKYGSLAVSVTDGSRNVQASVLIVKDLTRVEDLPLMGFSPRYTSPNGALAVQLAPGDYRVVALADAEKFHEPGVLERVMSSGQKITMSAGGAQTITLRLTDPR